MANYISKNFTWEEFCASSTAKQAGILNRIDTFDKRDAAVELVTVLLQPLRDLWNEPLYISSGYRCEKLNVLVGGSRTSQHVKGEAADIQTKGQHVGFSITDTWRLASLVRNTPELWKEVDQMIMYNNWLHLSHKKGGPQRGQIFCSKDFRGRRLKGCVRLK